MFPFIATLMVMLKNNDNVSFYGVKYGSVKKCLIFNGDICDSIKNMLKFLFIKVHMAITIIIITIIITIIIIILEALMALFVV